MNIAKVCKQIAVYWEAAGNDGYGGLSYTEPIEIKVRWRDRFQIILTSDGKEHQSQAEVWTLIDLKEEGFLYLGRLTSLDSDQLIDPKEISSAHEIIRFIKIPALRGNEYIRKVYL